jgi:subtilase family serine protease
MALSAVARRVAAGLGFLMVPFISSLPPISSSTALAAPVAPAPVVVRVQGAPVVPSGASSLGATAPSQTLTGAVALAPRDDAALQAFIKSVTGKSSPQYGQYLAPGAFQSQFGPLPSTISAVEQAVQADGLQVTGVETDGLLVDFSGTVGQAENTFHTGFDSYHMHGGWTGRGTTGAVELQLPSSISSDVTGVIGLNDLVQAQSSDIEPGSSSASASFPAAQAGVVPSVAGAPTPCTDAQQAAVSMGGLTDDQIANAYGAFGLYQQGDFGQGQHIAVYELQPFLATDIETFDTCYFGAAEAAQMSGTNGNLTGSRLSVTPVDGGGLQPGPGSQNDEATLDVEDVSAIAPEANIDVYEAPNTTFGGIDEYAHIINADTDQVITSSWAVCEQLAQTAEPGIQEEENFLFQQAAAQGQTVLSAAGDTGDDSCNSFRLVPPPAGQNLLSLLDPASQPYVVSVGGTTITDATQPPAEQVWNDGASWGGGGGGISETWAMPSWQQRVALTAANATDVSNAVAFESENAAQEAPFATPTFCDGTLGETVPCRETPDVSAQADEFTGAVTIFGVSLGYGPPNGWATIGGTSSATPIWAALLALVNQSSYCSTDLVTFATGKVQDTGFASPILYGIAANPRAYAASFNNVTSGNNDIYGLDNGLVFPARAGYNMASGLGSPQVTSPTGGPGLAYHMCHYAATLHPPVVTKVSPAFGSVAGSFTVTVTGSGFGSPGSPNVKAVEVGGGQATSLTVDSSTQLTVTLPPAIDTVPAASPNPTQDGAGPANIVVTNNNGQSSAISAASVFEYVDETGSSSTLPSVTGVSPYGGLDTSPVTVTIFGSGFVSPASGDIVEFGGVAATSVTYVSPFELTVTPPAFSALTPSKACPVDNGATGQPLNPEQDVCQVEVTVTTQAGTSATADILPPYEGPLIGDSMGAVVVPPGCGCEEEPQPSEYDYVPLPTITGVSTQLSIPASLASEFGGATTNVVEVTGTGMDPLTASYALLSGGAPFNENSIAFPLQDSGTFMILEAPALLPPGGAPSTEPVDLTVGFASLAGTSTENGAIIYAGVPSVTSVANTSNPRTLNGTYGAPDTGGAPLQINGSGFDQTVGPIGFVDDISGFSLGTQYNYTVSSDSAVTTHSVAQNPALVDVELCSNTSCSFSPPSDELMVYPPGAPVVTSVSPASGPASGGTSVVIGGQNLGCAVAATFGSAQATGVANETALLDCGATGLVDATTPAGKPSAKVPVKVETAESVLAPSTPVNQATFSYTGAPGSPVITSASSASALVGSPLSFTVTTSGSGAISVSQSGPLPGGVTFTPEAGGTALIHGTPGAGTGGTYYFNLAATSHAGSATQAFTLTVDQAPAITAPASDTVTLGAPVTITLTSMGYPIPAVSVSAGTLPAGLSASDGTDGLLVISGTPEPGSSGSYPLTLSASNSVGTAAKPFTIVVAAGS